MGEFGVSREALDGAAEMLADKVDVLLDRLASRAIDAPAAGSEAWRAEWVAGSEVDRARKVLLVRIAIAALAGVDARVDVQRARAAGLGWTEIGDAAGTTAQDAEGRWSESRPGSTAHASGSASVSTDPSDPPRQAVPTPAPAPPRRRPSTRKTDDQQIAMW